MSNQRTYRVMISGGGTGGHIYPAISIAQALEEELGSVEILFVGAQGKMEMKKVPEAGYKIEGLWISGLNRSNMFKNFSFPFKVMASLKKARKLIKEFNPDVVVGVGGYASGPLLYMATRMNIPTLIQEQNSYAGLTNKWLSKRVKRICVAHEGMEKYFPKGKLMVTGNPVRKGIVLDPSEKQKAFDFFEFSSDKMTILMTGGSLGARSLNEAMLASLDLFKKLNLQVIWQTGGFYHSEMIERSSDKDLQDVRVFDFLREMDLAYAVSDIVVARAGALSIAELELNGKAAILVPSSNVAEDHQTKNAKAMEENGAAVVIDDLRAKAELGEVVRQLISNAELIEKLERNIAAMARPDAAKTIANEVIKLAA